MRHGRALIIQGMEFMIADAIGRAARLARPDL